MEKKDYRQQVLLLRKNIEQSIEKIVCNKKQISIPFFYDEDDIDEDIETLIEEGYDVRVGNGINLYIGVDNYCGNIQQIEVIAICYRMGSVELIGKDSNLYRLVDVIGIYDLVEIYERIAN